MKIHPCRNCLIISACKQKSWLKLHNDCSKLSDYLFDKYVENKDEEEVRKKIEHTFIEIYPNTWKPSESGEWTWVTDVVKR